MKVLTITSKTHGIHNVLYDDADHELISKFFWCVVPNRKTFYAMTRLPQGNKKYKTLRMHQLFLSGKPIDHIDGNGLNNQRVNLRRCTNQQNNFNQAISSRNKSGYKGVHYHSGKYVACIRVSGKLYHGGVYETALEAAKRYNELAVVHHKDFAWLNPI